MTPDWSSADALQQLPKAELHLHIEGTLEPEMVFALAHRHGVSLPFADAQALRTAYQFDNLQSFLDLYYAGANVLRTAQDFYDMTRAYVLRAHEDGVVHAEIMFDPQTHTERGVPLEAIFEGLNTALSEAEQQWGITSYLILSFLRHLPEAAGMAILDEALPLRERYGDRWIAVGLDSAEKGNPPEKFARLYQRCVELGFHRVAHAGEEGPADYVRQALDILSAQRIDHGVRAEEDPSLIQRLIDEQVPLTVCPLSNLKLGVVRQLQDHNIARLLRKGLMVTINSDDPAYFGGYVLDNYRACISELALTQDEIMQLASNSVQASFLPNAKKAHWMERIQRWPQQVAA